VLDVVSQEATACVATIHCSLDLGMLQTDASATYSRPDHERYARLRIAMLCDMALIYFHKIHHHTLDPDHGLIIFTLCICT